MTTPPPLHSLLEGLNEPQREAVITTEGPLLLIAGAGSGKTKTLTHRLAYLMAEKGVLPSQILAVTFTNKAAQEMKKRLIHLMVGPERAQAVLDSFKGQGTSLYRTDIPVVGTFHSVCVQLLRKYLHLLGYENRFAIYDNTDSEILMKIIMKDLGVNPEKMNPRAILSHIAGAKNALLSPEEYAHQAHTHFSEKVAQIYPIYQKRLAQHQALDFEDSLMKTVELFEKEPTVLASLQERFRYISVDEYQDTNHAQYMIVKLLAGKYRNLCVVGDDWQSIYSWRGATMQNILDFEKDYPNAKVIKLEQNYRSTSLILDASHAIISKNRKRTDKKLWTDREGGEKIRVLCALDEREEGSLIARDIQRRLLQHESPQYKDFAILYRTNAQSRVVEEAMMRHGIPYRVVGGVKFYERKEIKDVLAYLRLIVNPADTVSLLRIINTPPRKIGGTTLERLQGISRERGDQPIFSVLKEIEAVGAAVAGESLNDTKVKTLNQFVDLIRKLQKVNADYPASGVIKHLIVESKFREFLLDGTPEGEARFENVQELVSVASKYDALEPGISLATFLEEVALISDLDQLDDRDNAATLMTLHSAKGLEFPYVYLCGLEEGIFPHSRSLLEPQELEEERRLMYVGLTRAMESATLLYAERRMLYGEVKSNAPSQFLRDLPEDLLDLDASVGGMGAKAAEAVGGILGNYFAPFSKRGTGGGSRSSGGAARGYGSSSSGAGGWGGGNFRPSNSTRRVPLESDSGFYPDAEPDYSSDLGRDSGSRIPIDYSAGDRVRHRTFGEGVVVEVKGGVLTIAFKDRRVGVKKLAASVAPLERI